MGGDLRPTRRNTRCATWVRDIVEIDGFGTTTAVLVENHNVAGGMPRVASRG